MSYKILLSDGKCLVVSLFVLLIFAGLPTITIAAESGEFNGIWIANGTREVFPFGEDRQVYTFKLSGHVNLQSDIGKTKDFWSKCVGLSDTESGTVARCVWQDLYGGKIFITLRSDRLQEDNLVTGEIVGGTDNLEGISGELSFSWSSVTFQKEGAVSTVTGQALGLEGNYRVP